MKPHSTKTLATLLLAPILIVLISFLILRVLPIFKVYVLNFELVLIFDLYPTFFYCLWLFQKVPYTDPTVLDKVVMSNAPRDVEKQLKSISKKYFVTNLVILFLGNTNKHPIQQEIVDHLEDEGVDLSSTRIRKILGRLESLHLIISVKGAHEREYSLTEKGTWCFKAIKYYFPKRNFLFILRNQLVEKELPQFPK